MPVMTNACGTGSAPKPAAAPLRATMPKMMKTAAEQIEGDDLAERLRIYDQAVEPESRQRRAA